MKATVSVHLDSGPDADPSLTPLIFEETVCSVAENDAYAAGVLLSVVGYKMSTLESAEVSKKRGCEDTRAAVGGATLL